jgi:hypothetical protein
MRLNVAWAFFVGVFVRRNGASKPLGGLGGSERELRLLVGRQRGKAWLASVPKQSALFILESKNVGYYATL